MAEVRVRRTPQGLETFFNGAWTPVAPEWIQARRADGHAITVEGPPAARPRLGSGLGAAPLLPSTPSRPEEQVPIAARAGGAPRPLGAGWEAAHAESRRLEAEERAAAASAPPPIGVEASPGPAAGAADPRNQGLVWDPVSQTYRDTRDPYARPGAAAPAPGAGAAAGVAAPFEYLPGLYTPPGAPGVRAVGEPVALPRYAEGGAVLEGAEGGSDPWRPFRRPDYTPPFMTNMGLREGYWVWNGLDWQPLPERNIPKGRTRPPLRFAEGGAVLAPMDEMLAPPPAMPNALVGEGMETETPQFDEPARTEVVMVPVAGRPGRFDVYWAEGATELALDPGTLIMPLPDSLEREMKEQLPPVSAMPTPAGARGAGAGGGGGPSGGGPGGAGPMPPPAMPFAVGGVVDVPTTLVPAAGGGQVDRPTGFGNWSSGGTPQPAAPASAAPAYTPTAQAFTVLDPYAGGLAAPFGNLTNYAAANEMQIKRRDQALRAGGSLAGAQGERQRFQQLAPGALGMPQYR